MPKPKVSKAKHMKPLNDKVPSYKQKLQIGAIEKQFLLFFTLNLLES